MTEKKSLESFSKELKVALLYSVKTVVSHLIQSCNFFFFNFLVPKTGEILASVWQE